MLQSISKNKCLIALLLPLCAFSRNFEKLTPTGPVDSLLCHTWIITSKLLPKVEGVRLVHGVESPSAITFNSDGTFIMQTVNDVKGR